MTAPKEASVVRFHELGGPDVLRIERTLVPPPGPGYVRINVRAIGLNRADAMFRRGTYIEKAVLPSRLGYEASGVVDAVGSEVHGLLQGDEVSVMPCPSLARHGTYSDTILMPATHVVPKPDHLSFEEAASLWMQSLTAFGGLIHAGGLQSGQTVLITAG